MQISDSALVAGLGVGLVVGLTGSGGGALLTPILVLFMGVNAKTAVASDLVASLFMRPVAGFFHLRHHTVRWPIVRLLVVGSVPAALLSGWASQLVPASSTKSVIEPAIGAALILSGGVALLLRARGARRVRHGGTDAGAPGRRLATVLVGVLGGAVVGITSVGSGTLVLVALGLLYPALAPAELVGTDLVQAVPLVAAATLGHLLAGGVHLTLTSSVAIGGVVGAAIGSLAAARVPAKPLGLLVAAVIFGSGCAMVGWIPGASIGAAAALGLAVAFLRAGRSTGRPASVPDEIGANTPTS